MIDRKDVRIDTYRSGAAGGLPSEAERTVRMTHIPTGISVEVSEHKTQMQNRFAAWDALEKKVRDYWDFIENHPGSPLNRNK